MASRDPREKTFLDDPSAYPEYALIVRRENLHHSLRMAFHQHRTAALLLIMAVSVAYSGAKMPPLGNASVEEWLAFLAKGLNSDLLKRHFEGVFSAIPCASVVTVASLLVYPLYERASRQKNNDIKERPSSPFASLQNTCTAIFIAVVPIALVWVIAVWAVGQFHWGVASGLIVALQSTCLTMKIVSFVMACGSSYTAGNSPPNGSSPVGGRDNLAASRPGESGAEDKNMGNYFGALTFEEFSFFLLCTPSLVCQPSQLRKCARRPRKVVRAASEFFHAALAFVAIHATCSAFFAPVHRVLAAAVHSDWADADAWMDVGAWEALRLEGRGDWLHNLSFAAGGAWIGEETFEKALVGRMDVFVIAVAVAAWFGMFVFSPLQHFLMFYGFWHCVCLGSAELWGYPDRNIYGPWWLVMDDLRDYFRMWSAPVYRWLAACVQRPMLEAGRRAARRRVNAAGGKRGHGSGGSIYWRWWFASVVCSFLVSGLLHEAVGFIALRRTVWPFNTFFLALSATMTPWWDILFPAVPAWPTGGSSPILEPSRKTPARKYPTETDKDEVKRSTEKQRPAQNAGFLASKDQPNRGLSLPEGETPCTPEAPSQTLYAVEGGAKSNDDDLSSAAVVSRPAIGSYRGWFASVFYMVASVPITLAVDYLIWQWWRQTIIV